MSDSNVIRTQHIDISGERFLLTEFRHPHFVSVAAERRGTYYSIGHVRPSGKFVVTSPAVGSRMFSREYKRTYVEIIASRIDWSDTSAVGTYRGVGRRRRAKRSAASTRGRSTPRRIGKLPPYRIEYRKNGRAQRRTFRTYADAQRAAFEAMRDGSVTRVHLAVAGLPGLEHEGKYTDMETWTIGDSGRYKHGAPREGWRQVGRRRGSAKRGAASTRRRIGRVRMTKPVAVRAFREDVLPQVYERHGRKDRAAVREAWNVYVDGLQRDGQITEHQASTWTNPVRSAR